jgi:hypothetical protein
MGKQRKARYTALITAATLNQAPGVLPSAAVMGCQPTMTMYMPTLAQMRAKAPKLSRCF